MRTLLWSYLGWHRFPRELSLFEVRRFFSLSLPDRHVLRRRFRSRARLGAAVIERPWFRIQPALSTATGWPGQHAKRCSLATV